jgi:hypothetical protein
MGFFGDYIRCLKASRRFGKGSRLMRRDEFANARDSFLAALQLLGADEPKNMAEAPWFVARFESLKGLAHCAAKLGDIPLALSSIKDAIALWDAADIGPATKYRGLPEWLAWARAYLAWSGKGDVH